MTPASAGRLTLPDGSYIDGNHIPWQHVYDGGRHPAGTCATCTPADNWRIRLALGDDPGALMLAEFGVGGKEEDDD